MSIVFYSPQCKYSKEIMIIIEQNNINIKKVNINNLKTIPSFLQKVPTIIADGVSQPLVGKQALDWVINQKFFNIVSNNINQTKHIEPFKSNLLASTSEKPDSFCSIGESTALIFPTLKDLR
jgi:hypothetical protein